MKNFISINGNTTELTDEQVRELGFSPDTLLKQAIDELSAIVKSGNAREHYNLYDTVHIGDYELQIIGFDHDEDCNVDSLDVMFRDESPHTITLMAKTLLPARCMHNGACENGWIDTDLRKYLNTEFINTLPQELVSHICTIEKETHNYDGKLFKTKDRLFIPSESELFGSAIWSDYEDGPRYEAFATCADRIRLDEDGDGDWYWSRSARGGYSTYFAYVSYVGGAVYGYASDTSIRAPLCFCLA